MTAEAMPMPVASRARASAPDAGWLALLARSERGGRDAAPRLEGKLPAGLSGSLYRNGPGLFERGALRKRNLLDGDGLIQRLSFAEGAVRYQNAFVQTAKFRAEQQAGRYLHPTWTTLLPGGPWRNWGARRIRSQAGVTIYPIGGRLLALDEVGPAASVDGDTLATLQETQAVATPGRVSLKAHARHDPVTGEWLLAGVEHGPVMHIETYVLGGDGALRSRGRFRAPRQVYFHDFAVSERHFVFVLGPLDLQPLPFLLGLKPLARCLRWRADAPTIICLAPRDGGAARFVEAPAVYSWHLLNAYERDGGIVVDFVGYDAPDHFAAPDGIMWRLMDGARGRADSPGKLRRLVVDPAKGRCAPEVLDHGDHEFPMTDPRVQGRQHRFGYLAAGAHTLANSIVKRVDFQTGAQASFDFGPHVHVGEPVFAPAPSGGIDDGWLLVQGLDGATSRSFFAVLEAGSLASGPLARLWLDHPLPISFHGCWVPG